MRNEREGGEAGRPQLAEDEDAAVDALLKASGMQSAAALNELGVVFRDGLLGQDQDLKRSFEAFNESVSILPSPDAQWYVRYERGVLSRFVPHASFVHSPLCHPSNLASMYQEFEEQLSLKVDKSAALYLAAVNIEVRSNTVRPYQYRDYMYM